MKHAGDKKTMQKRLGLTLLILSHDNSAYRMQGEKHQKRISAQNSDKTPKRSLCSTLYSWCSTPDTGTHQITHSVVPILPAKDWSNVLYFKGAEDY